MTFHAAGAGSKRQSLCAAQDPHFLTALGSNPHPFSLSRDESSPNLIAALLGSRNNLCRVSMDVPCNQFGGSDAQ
jgi:hypothetical protein